MGIIRSPVICVYHVNPVMVGMNRLCSRSLQRSFYVVCGQELLFFSSEQLFAERSKEHEKFGGDPEQPHKLHLVTRVKSVMRRPYWEKEIVKHLGLQKVKLFLESKSSPTSNTWEPLDLLL